MPAVFAEPEVTPEERLERLADAIALEVNSCLGDLAPDEVGLHLASSTIIDVSLACRAGVADDLIDAIAARTAHPPLAIMNAYECAGWGYILRHALAQRPRPRRVACTIVDLNLLDVEFWRSSPHWGGSGFGIGVLLLELGEQAERDLVVGHAKTPNMLAEFALAVRKAAEASPAASPRVGLPFFPAHVSEMFDRVIRGIERLPDQHGRLGHCFGSDPWILALQHAASGVAERRLHACSVALNGYWAVADVEVDPDARLRLELAA
jgi:hypothetical protein